MKVLSKDDLKEGATYYYLTIPYCCHFDRLKVKHEKYSDLKSVDGMIIFDSESEAETFRMRLENFMRDYILTKKNK